jgi:conjugal transfer pilus assembly protein TraI
MKSLLARFRKAPIVPSPSPSDEEIPRYPPFAKGLPAASVERILATQAELVESIRHTLALPDEDFQTILWPVVERYAAFTHLLPASEAHHHHGAGGLFRHGLEVAYWAALASEGVVFGAGATPRERKAQEPRWRLAVCLAGLLHDIGKPVSDLSILDRAGTTQWNPYLENLTDWAVQNGVDRYFLRWRDKRHRRHEQFSVLVAERVLTPVCLSHLTQPGPDILQAMLEAIAGVERGGVFHTLVIEADRKSVERDLKANHLPAEASLGVPVEKYLLDAMRRLVRDGRWSANVRGTRLWRFAEGLHVVWKTAAQEIGELLAKDKVPGIPRDPDTLADILIERGLAIPRRTSDGRTYRYWRMAPAELGIALYMLRLTSPELIYPGEPPLIVEGRVLDETETDLSRKEENSERAPKEPRSPVTLTKFAPERRQEDGLSRPNTEVDIMAEPIGETPANPESGAMPSSKAINPGGGRHLGPVERTHPGDGPSTSDDPMQRPEPSPKTSPRVMNSPKTDEKLDPDPSHSEALAWLVSQGMAGELLRATADLCRAEPMTGLRLVEGRVWIPHPVTAQRLGHDPKEFLRILDESGWIETDLLSPLRKIREVGGTRGLMLTPEVSRYWSLLAGGTPFERATIGTKSSLRKEQSPVKTGGRKPARKAPGKTPPTIPAEMPAHTPQSISGIHPDRDPTGDRGSAEDLVRSIRQREGLPHPTTESGSWLSVPYGILDWYVERHPGLNRAKLIVELHRHADCLLEGHAVLKVRKLSE